MRKAKTTAMNNVDRERFEDTALQYMDQLYNTAFYLTRNTEEAEDLVQDTYMRAFRFFDKYEEGTNFKAWINRIMKNTFINKYRKAQRTPPKVQLEKVKLYLEDEKSAIDEQKEQALDGNEHDYKFYFNDDVYSALNSLPKHQREVLLLFAVQNMQYKEIAKMLDRPTGTVMSRMFRGRQRMHEILADQVN